MTAPTWYRKRTDPGALYTARMLGKADLFASIGARIHKDDMPDVLKALGTCLIGVQISLFESMPPSLEEMRARLAYLNDQIAGTKRWGAAITAMDEERRGLLRGIALTEDKPLERRHALCGNCGPCASHCKCLHDTDPGGCYGYTLMEES